MSQLSGIEVTTSSFAGFTSKDQGVDATVVRVGHEQRV